MSGIPLISVIDDDESLRVALVGLVRSVGYEALGFDSAEDFLQSDGLDRSACVVTDIQMPGMSGIDLKLALTARQNTVPVIMITARSEPELEQRARASGAACFLKKPFDGGELISCIEDALRP